MPLEFPAEFPGDVPGSVEILELEPPLAEPGVAMERLRETAERFGLTGEGRDYTLSDDWTTYQEPPYELGLHTRSGAILFRHLEKYLASVGRPFDLSDEEAESIATEFVDRIGLFSMDTVRLYRVTHLLSEASRADGRERVERKALDAGVVFRRLVSGIQAVGSGGIMMVNVDPEGEVVGLRNVWRAVAGVAGEVPIRPPEEAYERMETIAADARGDVIVTKAEFGYYERGELDPQKFLQPAYVLMYVLRDEEVSAKKIEVVPAGFEVFEQLEVDKRFALGKQPPRE
jgi:hypothetical protein